MNVDGDRARRRGRRGTHLPRVLLMEKLARSAARESQKQGTIDTGTCYTDNGFMSPKGTDNQHMDYIALS